MQLIEEMTLIKKMNLKTLFDILTYSSLQSFQRFVTKCIHPNGRSGESHGALFYFHSHFTRIDPPKLSEKDWEKVKASVVAEFNRAQLELGMKTMGASTFRRHLEEHFPRATICPHKEDYCDKYKALGTDMSRCRFVIKIKESGNATAEKLQPHENELAALLKEQQEHLKDAKLAREFYNKLVSRCKEQWTMLSTAEGGTDTNRHTFTLVLSADYQQAKLIPYWGKSAQPACTYYMTKESYDIFGIVNHRDNTASLSHDSLSCKQLYDSSRGMLKDTQQ